MFRRAGLFLVLGLLIVGWIVPAGQAQEDARTLFRQAIDAYEQGDFEKCAELADKVLALDPTADEATELANEAGVGLLTRMMATDGEIGDSARKILKLAGEANKRMRSDPERIGALVEDIKSEDFRTQFHAEQVIIHTVGHYIFTNNEVVEVLSNQQADEFRARVVRLFSEMGEDAVLPLCELTALDNDFGKANVLAILGNIRDRRALPYLKREWEGTQDPVVKKQAAVAIEKVTAGDKPEKLPPSPDLFLNHAANYYYDDPIWVNNKYGDWTVWALEDGQLTSRVVPAFSWNEIMAEDLCYKGLAVNATSTPLWTLVCNTYYARVTEVESALEVAAEKVSRGEMEQEQMDVLQGELDQLGKARPLATVLGEQGILAALDQSLQDGRVNEAVAAIRALQEFPLSTASLPTGKADAGSVKPGQLPSFGSGVGAPLIKALFHGDKRVRYAAANAVVRLGPRTEVEYRRQAVLNLIEAAGEKSPRLVLVIEQNSSLRNKIVSMLGRYNFLPMGVSTVNEGKRRGLFFPPEDLFIIGETLSDGKAHELIDVFRSDFRTSHIPILVLAEPARVSRAEDVYRDRADGVVGADIDEVVLKDRIDALFEATAEGTKQKADRIAAEAAESLAMIDPTDTVFDLKGVAEALRETLEGRPDFVRIPAMHALGNLRDAGAIPMLTNLVTNRNNDEAARVAALDALGEILARQKAVTPETFIALKDAIAESAPGIYEAAGTALGKAPLDANQRRDIYNAERIP